MPGLAQQDGSIELGAIFPADQGECIRTTFQDRSASIDRMYPMHEREAKKAPVRSHNLISSAPLEEICLISREIFSHAEQLDVRDTLL